MALEGRVDFTQPPLSFWGHSSVSETCEYQTERSLTRMSEWRDYLIEFEWSVPGVEEENTAVRLNETIVMDHVKRIWYLSPMRAAKVQASLRIRAVSPEPSLLAHTSSESRGTFRQKARSLVPLNGWACAVEICHDGMLEDTNSLDGARIVK